MCHELVACPKSHIVHAAISRTRSFVTAGSTLHHGANLSVAAFAVRSHVWAARFCSQRPCWRVLSRSCAAQACVALLDEGAITATIAHTLRAAAKLPNVFDTCVSNSKNICWVCGQLNVCMICGWLLACCLLQVVRRLRSIDNAPTGEAAFAARAAGA